MGAVRGAASAPSGAHHVAPVPAPALVRPLRGRRLTRIAYYAGLLRRTCHAKLAVANVLSSLLPNYASGVVRGRLYRLAGFPIHPTAFLMGNLALTSGFPDFYTKLSIGPGATISDHVTINLDAPVTIGANAAIAPHVLICTGNHVIGPGSMRLGQTLGLPVTIEDGAWVRLGAIIAPGVTVGRGSIVASGAVVLKDVPANTFVEGNPARVVHRLPWGDR